MIWRDFFSQGIIGEMDGNLSERVSHFFQVSLEAFSVTIHNNNSSYLVPGILANGWELH